MSSSGKNHPRDQIPEFDRRLVPIFAIAIIGIIDLAVACFWVGYQL